MVSEEIKPILDRNTNGRTRIITILQEIQDVYNYLPEEALRVVSEKVDIPLIDLYSVASFYNAFSLTPRGKHVCNVCMGTACHVRGAQPVLDEMKRKLDIEEDETTPDGEFTLKTVNCLGACALGPIVMVDDDYHGNTTIQQVEEILAKYSNDNE